MLIGSALSQGSAPVIPASPSVAINLPLKILIAENDVGEAMSPTNLIDEYPRVPVQRKRGFLAV